MGGEKFVSNLWNVTILTSPSTTTQLHTVDFMKKSCQTSTSHSKSKGSYVAHPIENFWEVMLVPESLLLFVEVGP